MALADIRNVLFAIDSFEANQITAAEQNNDNRYVEHIWSPHETIAPVVHYSFDQTDYCNML